MTREESIGKWIYPAITTMWNANKCNEILEALEQEPRWIPVSERSPEDNKEVLVYVNAYPYLAWLDGGEWKTEDFIIEKDFEPIAWMPLPEPYKAESEDKE